MSRQGQEVGAGATAVQALGDVTINNGISPAQMSEIMMGLAKQLYSYLAEADQKAEERYATIREDIIAEFQHRERANPEAFKDPDFQHLLRDAQDAYARSGEAEVGETLVQLLAKRSLQPGRSRLALILNQATETVGKLTREELSALTVAFVMSRTGGWASTRTEYSKNYRELVAPFVSDLPASSTSYEYLQSLGCVNILEMMSRPIGDLVRHEFGGIFAGAISSDEIRVAFGGHRPTFFPPIFSLSADDASRERFTATNMSMLEKQLDRFGVIDPQRGALKTLFERSMPEGGKIRADLIAELPEFSRMAEIWESTPLEKMSLTSLGVVLAHSNLTRVATRFSADLSIWVS